MEKMSLYLFTAAFVTLIGAGALYLVHAVALTTARGRVLPVRAGVGALAASESPVLRFAGRGATMLGWNGGVFLVLTLVARGVAASRGPFSNMYEYSLAFAAGIVLAYLIFEKKFGYRSLGAIAVPIALILMWYASTLPNDIAPLVPALQNNLLLTLHVTTAIIAYGFFAVAFGGSFAFLIRRVAGTAPEDMEGLDEIGYRAVAIGFPAMALVIILGSIWAETAWGRWWGWDPKETASLVTFLLYAAYLHARVFRGWVGTKSAALLVVGFGAVMFTYFGNLVFGGLHSYA